MGEAESPTPAQILGKYWRDLAAEGVPEGVAAGIVQDAAVRMHDGDLRVDLVVISS